jgi:hypothetical protein
LSSDPRSADDEQPEVDNLTLSEVFQQPIKAAGDLSEVADASPDVTTEDLARDLEAVASKLEAPSERELLLQIIWRLGRIEQQLEKLASQVRQPDRRSSEDMLSERMERSRDDLIEFLRSIRRDVDRPRRSRTADSQPVVRPRMNRRPRSKASGSVSGTAGVVKRKPTADEIARRTRFNTTADLLRIGETEPPRSHLSLRTEAISMTEKLNPNAELVIEDNLQN